MPRTRSQIRVVGGGKNRAYCVGKTSDHPQGVKLDERTDRSDQARADEGEESCRGRGDEDDVSGLERRVDRELCGRTSVLAQKR